MWFFVFLFIHNYFKLLKLSGVKWGKNFMAQIRPYKNKKRTTYQVVIRKKGFKDIYKTFDEYAAAKKWARAMESQIDRGVYKEKSNITPKAICTVEDLIKDFKDNVAIKRYSKPEQYNCMYDWWIAKIGSLTLQEVDTSVLNTCKHILLNEPPDKPYKGHKTKSNSTVRKYIFALSACLTYAEKELELIDRNPVSKISKPKKAKGIVRFLSDSERTELIDACEKHSKRLYLFVMLALFSGGRYNEIRTLNVENVDFNNNMVHFIDTKNKEDRGVPIHPTITKMITDYIEENEIETGYIFFDKKQKKLPYLKGAFESVIKDTSIKNFRFHDLRHTYASYLAQNGAELLEIAELMGHKNLQQVKIYAHLTRKHTSRLVQNMTEKMLSI